MTPRESASRRPVAPARRSHHIADIAHHFLADERPETEAPVWVVAASGPWPWSAPAALELARLTVRRTGGGVRVAEDGDVPWSVRGHLGVGDGDLCLADPRDADAHGPDPLCWHLGPVAGTRLDDLAAARRAPGSRLPGDGRPRRLVWCVGYEEVDGWAPLLGLGRLNELLEPMGVDLLCMPGRSGRAQGEAPPVPARLARLAERAGDACARHVAVHLLSVAMSVAARGAVIAAVHGREPEGATGAAFCAGPDGIPPLV
jgi:hypothetical protein